MGNLARTVHLSVFLGGMGIAAFTENAIYRNRQAQKNGDFYSTPYMTWYTAEVFAIGCAAAGGVFLIYDIESERREKREREKNRKFFSGGK